jgi:hypothetical protein
LELLFKKKDLEATIADTTTTAADRATAQKELADFVQRE